MGSGYMQSTSYIAFLKPHRHFQEGSDRLNCLYWNKILSMSKPCAVFATVNVIMAIDFWTIF